MIFCSNGKSQKAGDHPQFQEKRSRSEKAILGALGLWKRKAATGPESRNDFYLTQKSLKRDFFLFLQRDSKVTKKRHSEPQKSLLSHFEGQKVSFWSLLSLFVERGEKRKKSLLSLFWVG